MNRYGVHIFSYAGTDWTKWYATRQEQEEAYKSAKKRVGLKKSAKTPFRIVKKVVR